MPRLIGTFSTARAGSEYTAAHAKAASNIQQVKSDLAAAEQAERDAADERRVKKAKAKSSTPAPTPGLFDDDNNKGEEQ